MAQSKKTAPKKAAAKKTAPKKAAVKKETDAQAGLDESQKVSDVIQHKAEY